MYKCPQFSEEDFVDDETETDDDHEPLFEQSDVNPVENMAVEQPEASVNNNPVVVKGVWPNRIDPNQKSGIVRMLDNVASSLIYIMRPICALSNKVKVLKSFLQNLWTAK